MTSQIDLTQIEKNVRQAYRKDGLAYIFIGLMLFMVGLSFREPALSWLGAMSVFVMFLAERVRRRFTYPRVGYARLKVEKKTVRGIIGFGIVAIIGLVLLAIFIDRLLPVGIALTFGLSMYFGFASQGSLRLRDWFLVLLTLVSGGLTAYFFPVWRNGVSIQLWSLAAVLLVFGSIDFVRFLRAYPDLSKEAADDQEST